MDISSRANLASASQSDRLFWIDFLKAISMMAVVSYHSLFLPTSAYAEIAPWVEVIFAPLRFCVPVLLTLSFFLVARSLEKYAGQSKLELCQKRISRLLVPTLFWFSIAAGLRYFGQPAERDTLWLTLLQGKVFPGAYYLLVMLQLVPLAIWSDRFFKSFRNILLTIGIQVLIFLMINASLESFISPDLARFLAIPARTLIIYWFAYVGLGIYFQQNWDKIQSLSARISPTLKVTLILLTSLLMLGEFHHLYNVTSGDPIPFEYALVSGLLSVFILLLCFANLNSAEFPDLPISGIKLISKYSLGIFCINGILSLVFLQLGNQLLGEFNFNFIEILSLKLIGWIGLLTLSVFLSQLLDRLGLGNCVR